MLKFIIVNYVVIESNFFTLFEQMISKKTSKNMPSLLLVINVSYVSCLSTWLCCFPIHFSSICFFRFGSLCSSCIYIIKIRYKFQKLCQPIFKTRKIIYIFFLKKQQKLKIKKFLSMSNSKVNITQ